MVEFIQAADEGTLYWFENHHSSLGNAVMEFCTRLGDPVTVIAVAVAAAVLFLAARQRRTALVMLASLLGLGICVALKYAIGRERPDVAWRLIEPPHSPSFPSGHALNSLAIYGTLALLASRRIPWRVISGLVLLAGFLLPLAIGVSRPYLGVHYPSDVLAGWTAGLACALLALWASRRE